MESKVMFKVGDEVKYTGRASTDLFGLNGVVINADHQDDIRVQFDNGKERGVYSHNLTHVTNTARPGDAPGSRDRAPSDNNGGSTSYYQLPKGAVELADLIEDRKMNFNVGNIFKAAYRLGEKAGVNDEYDLNKIVFFAQRELKRIKKNG